jgi:hypothetical protein
MTREQLDAIRARVDEAANRNWSMEAKVLVDARALLAEVEGMRESCTGLVKQNERQYDEVLRLTTEVERLTADPLPAAAWVREVERAAFARGVAAMRAAAVEVASKRANLPKHSDLDSAWCRSAECILDELRHLPDPEDES